MGPADLVAIMTFQQRRRARAAGLHRQPRAAARGHPDADLRRRCRTATAIPDPLPGAAFGQDDGEFNIFNTDRQLSALQTAVTMLRPLPEQKSLIYLRQRPAAERHRQPGAAARHRQRRDPRQRRHPHRSTRAAWWRRRRSAMRRGRRPAASACSTASSPTPRQTQLPAVAGHALRAGEGHRRQGDVRLQRSVAGHRAGGASR